MTVIPQTDLLLHKQIKYLASALGTGIVKPVAYDTAWVARIPSLSDPRKPAFPQSLQWLREHQLHDGSWGTARPFYAHGNTLSTLAAILAFKQWGNLADDIYIERGLNALWNLADYLPCEPYESIGFELLLPTFQQEAEAYGLVLPDHAYEHYRALREVKQRLIANYTQDLSMPRAWWFSLEALTVDEIRQQNGFFCPEELLTQHGSVALSPAATAYLLRLARLNGRDLPAAQQYLAQLAAQNNNGIPHVTCLDGMELAFGLDYFLKAGIDPRHPALAPSVEALAAHFDVENGLGYSSSFIPDADETAVALRVLALAGYPVTARPLLKFFNGIHMVTYPDERVTSLSCNIHALNTLKLFAGDPEVDAAILSILAWLESQIVQGQPYFADKWHASPIYSTSRAIFALEGLNDSLAAHCAEWLLEIQQENGGWGMCGQPTAEETALAVLALKYWQDQGYYVPQESLECAQTFLETYGKGWPQEELWIGKTLYCPVITTAAAIAAARYALQQ